MLSDLQKKINALKVQFSKKEQKDKKFQEEFKQVISGLFPRHKNPMEYIRDFYVRDTTLIVQTTNKAFAHELFIRKIYLQEKLRNITIQRVVIH